jgi:hypothetical protein
MKENTDYEMIAGTGENWDIRILTGEFNETVLAFSTLKVTDDGEHLSFNFDIVSSPVDDLDADTNFELQETAGLILENILASAAHMKNEEEKK